MSRWPVARAGLLLVAALAAVSYGGPATARTTARLSAAHTGTQASMAETDVAVLFCTVPDADNGRKIAAGLLEKKLAACINAIPGVESMYTWEGKMETSQEVLLKIKTQRSLVEKATSAIVTMHPYDEPEVIAVPVVGGAKGYLDWVKESTTGAEV